MAGAKRRVKIEFTTGRVIKRNRLVTSKAFKDVAAKMTAKLQKTISKPVGIRRGKRGGVHKIRSKPGEPPRKDTGFLHANVEVIAKGRKVEIKTPLYGAYLDGGTRSILARPWIRKTIHDQRRFWERQFNTAMRRFSK
jgi:hypothetical protein